MMLREDYYRLAEAVWRVEFGVFLAPRPLFCQVCDDVVYRFLLHLRVYVADAGLGNVAEDSYYPKMCRVMDDWNDCDSSTQPQQRPSCRTAAPWVIFLRLTC